MKKLLLLVIGALAAGACSSPKYTYHFDHYDYNSGKKQPKLITAGVSENISPLIMSEESVVTTSASTVETPVAKPEEKADKQMILQKIRAMSQEDRARLKKDIKTELKKYTDLKKSPVHVGSNTATKEWDRDLKLAAIFGAVGLVLSLFSGVNSVFWVLAVIALVIGVVFLIKWLARQ